MYAQEASTFGQGATQRERWRSGRLDTLRRYWRDIIVSDDIGWHQKLDALAELGEPSPVIPVSYTHLTLPTNREV